LIRSGRWEHGAQQPEPDADVDGAPGQGHLTGGDAFVGAPVHDLDRFAGVGDLGFGTAGILLHGMFGAYPTDELHIPPDVFDPALDEVDFGGEQPAAA
jgi:hypothetical protein